MVPNTSNDIRRKCRAKSETIQHITGGCLALSQGDYTHRHKKFTKIVHQKLAIKCGLSKGHQCLIINMGHSPYWEKPSYKM